jgi:integrase
MKTTTKICFQPARQSSGKGRLAFRIIRDRESRVIKTPYLVSSNEWSETSQKLIPPEGSLPKRQKELALINGKLKKEMQLIHKTAEQLEAGGNYTAQDLVNQYRLQLREHLFCEYVLGKVKELKEAKRFGTAHTYLYATISFAKFLKGSDINLDKINPGLMKDFEHYLKAEKKSENTISCYMRSLRAAYNQAIEEKILPAKKSASHPFSGVFTGNAKTRKRAINADNILLLKELELEQPAPDPSPQEHLSPDPSPQERGAAPHPCGEGRKERSSLWAGAAGAALSRDLFMFSFYTQGMSFSDMANLKKENIRDDFILYNRKKTGQAIAVELENCMKKIIGRYFDPDSDLIFPVLREYAESGEFIRWQKTRAALASFNRNLNRLARRTGIGSRLTSYVSRHSWASIASQKGVSIATISKGMGHESEKTTRIYISQLDYSDVAEANKQILSRFAV